MKDLERKEENLTPEIPVYIEETKGGVPVGQQLMLVAGVLLLIFGTTLTPLIISSLKGNSGNTEEDTIFTEEIVNENNNEISPFSDVKIVGKAAYVFDVQNQRALYKKNEGEVLPLASVTKLMTALLADEILNEDTSVAISNSALNQDGDSGLLLQETFKRSTLSDLTLMSSSNDGAFALAAAAGRILDNEHADNAFVTAMNVRAKELNLKETTFNNPTGLDISTSKAGAYGSARDMTFLMEYIIKNNPNILELTKSDSVRVYSQDGNSHEADNTNYYIDNIPGLIGSKTGYTDLAGGNLVIAYDAGLNRPIIITVLGSTQQNRFTDVMKLIEETNDYVAKE